LRFGWASETSFDDPLRSSIVQCDSMPAKIR
jgi:hypothetical protein